MITIFSIPKPFSGKTAILQKNAINNWRKSLPAAEIILLGKDAGVEAIAREYGVRHLPEVSVNEFGTPLLNSAFSLVREQAQGDVLFYINADIIIMPDIDEAVKKAMFLPAFLLAGRRWDLAVGGRLEFTIGWEQSLREKIDKEGRRHGFSGIDYFIFPKTLILNLPAFAVGRQGWDNWLLWYAKKNNIPIIDATNSITAIHQDHDYAHSKYGEKDRVGGPEKDNNYKLAGNLFQMLSMREADYILNQDGLRKPNIFRLVLSKLAKLYLWQLLFTYKRRIQYYWDNLNDKHR